MAGNVIDWEYWYRKLMSLAHEDESMRFAINTIDEIHEDCGAFKYCEDKARKDLNWALDKLESTSDYEFFTAVEEMIDYFGFRDLEESKKAKNIVIEKCQNKRSDNKMRRLFKEHYDVSTVEGLAKYSRDLAAAVLDGKLFDSNAVLAICATLRCNEDYAAECLDAWIETEQIRRSNLKMVAENKRGDKMKRGLKEASHSSRVQLTTDEELLAHAAAGVEIIARGTGPFGENQGATVTCVGTVYECRRDIEIDYDEYADVFSLDEDDFEDSDEWMDAIWKNFLEDYKDMNVVVLDTVIGQSKDNFYVLDDMRVEDMELFVDPDDYIACKPEDGTVQVKTAEELKDLLASGETVYAASTGPFGENKGAEVVAFGKIGVPGINKRLWIDESEMGDLGYESKEEYLADFAGTEVIVLNDTIGQSDCNFYMLDARDVADCNLYTK